MTSKKLEIEKNEKDTNGGRNLVMLGILAVVVALLTTGISLMVYHNSGDIYLDRSRPGYLPDEEEIEEESGKEVEDYNFEKSGRLTKEAVEEYLEKLEVEIEAIDAYDKPFDAGVLSDERLGIPSAETQP